MKNIAIFGVCLAEWIQKLMTIQTGSKTKIKEADHWKVKRKENKYKLTLRG